MRIRDLALLLLIVLGFVGTVLAQQSGPVVAVPTKPAWSCTSSLHKSVYLSTDDGKFWKCLSNAWVEQIVGSSTASGASGVVQFSNGAGSHQGDVDFTFDSTLNAIRTRHLFLDPSGDGTPEVIPITDLDGNGTYTFTADLVNTMAPYVGDLQICNTTNGSVNVTSTAPNKPARRLRVGTAVEGSGIQAGTTVASITGDTTFTLSLPANATAAPSLSFIPAARWDVDQDGTNESMGILFLLPPVRVLAGFHDSLYVLRGGVDLVGAGEDSSFIDVVGDCSVQGVPAVDDFDSNGVADYLDNNDTTQNFGTMFVFLDTRASKFGIGGITIDGGSNQYLNSRLPTTDANFCDANGGSGPNACNRGGGKWCPLDEHFIFNSGTTDSAMELSFWDLRIRRADSNAWEMDGQGSGTGKRKITWDHVDVFGSGEESIQMRGEGTITNSHFEQCGGTLSDCITLSPGAATGVDASRQQIIANNVFRDCGGPCIKQFATTVDAASKMLNLTITGNDYRTNNSYGNLGFFNAQWSPTSASQLHSGITISDNTLDCGVLPNGVDCISLQSNDTTANTWPTPPSSMTYDRVGITGNTIHVSGDTLSDTSQGGISLTRAKNFTIQGNTIVIDADTNAACSGGTEDKAILLNKSIDGTVGPNQITVNGDCTIGISVIEGSNLTFPGGSISGPGDTTHQNTAVKLNPVKDSHFSDLSMPNWDFGVRAFSASTGNTVKTSRCTNSLGSCVELNTGNEQRNTIAENYAESCVGSCFNENAGLCAGGANAGLNCTSDGNCPSSTCTTNVTNLWLGNTGRKGGGLYSLKMLSGHGWTYQPDVNNDGTNDANSGLLLHKLTQIWYEGDGTADALFGKLRWIGTGAGNFIDFPTLTSSQATTTTVLTTNTAAANLPFVRCGNVSVDAASVGATSSLNTAVAVTNMEASAACSCSPRTDFNDDLIMKACFSTAGNINVTLYNPTGAGIDPGAITVDYCCTEQ